ncbi:hypothetical protein [Chryseobacterium sp.]|uniref:hypothetical protein n=1 Tax=Chryseobacterium sp. TaxID=1871047 RepID=UPI0012AA210D|nr:hypothetical protein [Chryseobacterium sp.]QFG52389.1 hypothetical protein F7R58_02010 [Chryseobacterium sp.]
MFDQFDDFAEDLLMEKSDRIIVIVCASKIDDLLFAILDSYLLPKISGKKDDLLEGDQPLATFSSKIKATYRLGIIDKSYYNLLEQLRAIRNKSAHNVTFDILKSPFKDHLSNIRNELLGRKSFELTKSRYFSNLTFTSTRELQCILLTLCVILQAVQQKIVKTTINDETIKISKS